MWDKKKGVSGYAKYLVYRNAYSHIHKNITFISLFLYCTHHYWAFIALDGDCTENEHLCDNDQCIPKSEVCDGKIDCNDKTDEMGCEDSISASSDNKGM